MSGEEATSEPPGSITIYFFVVRGWRLHLFAWLAVVQLLESPCVFQNPLWIVDVAIALCHVPFSTWMLSLRQKQDLSSDSAL